MKKLPHLMWVYCLFMGIHLSAQIPPHGFNYTMSRATLELYLSRSAFFDRVNDACYYGPGDRCFEDADKAMLASIKPLMLSRAATTWGGDDWEDFAAEVAVAQKIHAVDSTIIIGAFLSEFLTKRIIPPPADGIHILIPSYVKLAFGYTGSAQYFDYRDMTYSDVLPGNPCAALGSHVWGCSAGNFDGITPNMNKMVSKMFYYYVATQLIDAKYEAFSIGEWDWLNDEDPGNVAMWDVFSKIRSYANTHTGNNRHLVLITGSSVTTSLNRGNDANPTNNLPYYNYVAGSNTNRLLFDFMENTSAWQEDGYVANGTSPFYRSPTDIRYERLVKPGADFSIFQFGGETAQAWGWTAAQKLVLPYVLHMDVGGPNLASEEGQLNYDNGQTNGTSYRTWGWGGELNYFMYTTLPYRRHLLHVMAHQIREKSNNNAYLLMPLRGPVSSNYFKFSAPYIGPPYNLQSATGEIGFLFRANEDAIPNPCSVAANSTELFCYPPNVTFGIENQVKEIWDKSSEVNFCAPVTFTGDFTEAQGFTSPDYPRFLIDVDNDGDKDIVGIGSNTIRVSIRGPYSFLPSTVWATTTLTTSGGWNSTSYLRTTGDFNGDHRQDLIGFGPGGVWVGLSTGSAFVFTRWTTDFGNTNNTTDEWANSKSVRMVADINHDQKDDIVGFGNAATYQAISNGTNGFGPKTQWFWDFSNSGGYNNTDHLRTLADINNDGYPDLVAFGESGVYAALNTYASGLSTITGSSTLLLNDWCKTQGWSTVLHSRRFADMNGDGWVDMVGFGQEGVLVALNTKNASGVFASPPAYWTYQFGSSTRAGGWTNTSHVRILADVNGDAKQDVVAFGQNGMDVMLSMGSYFTNIFHYPDFGNLPAYGGWNNTAHLRTAANFDSDTRSEILCFGQNTVFIMNNCGITFKPVGNGGTSTEANPSLPEDFSFYPNPASNLLQVNVGETTEFTQFTVLDHFGRIQAQFERNGDERSMLLDISKLPAGMYTLALQKGERVLKAHVFVKTE